MLSIADLAGWKEKRTKVRIGDREIQIRALSMKDRARAEVAAGAMPAAPLKANPNKGSIAPLEADDRDPGYLAQRQQWLRRLATAQVVLMTDYQSAGMVKEGRTITSDDDVKAAIEEVQGVLPEMVVEHLLEAQERLVSEMTEGKDPLKN